MRFATIMAGILLTISSSLVQAASVTNQVTPEYVRKNPGKILVAVTKGKDGLLNFTVTLTLEQPRYVVSHLQVWQKGKLLAESHTPLFTRNRQNEFHFSIAPELLVDAKFELGTSGFGVSNGEAIPLPGTIDYQIQLKEFMPADVLKPNPGN